MRLQNRDSGWARSALSWFGVPQKKAISRTFARPPKMTKIVSGSREKLLSPALLRQNLDDCTQKRIFANFRVWGMAKWCQQLVSRATRLGYTVSRSGPELPRLSPEAARPGSHRRVPALGFLAAGAAAAGARVSLGSWFHSHRVGLPGFGCYLPGFAPGDPREGCGSQPGRALDLLEPPGLDLVVLAAGSQGVG